MVGDPTLRGGEDLTVESTAISGSLQAVQCRGDGELQGVRVCPHGNQTLFWFTVDVHAGASPATALDKHLQEDVLALAPLASWQRHVGDGDELQREVVLSSMHHKRRRVMAFGGSSVRAVPS
jgi:hypothetical protein